MAFGELEIEDEPYGHAARTRSATGADTRQSRSPRASPGVAGGSSSARAPEAACGSPRRCAQRRRDAGLPSLHSLAATPAACSRRSSQWTCTLSTSPAERAPRPPTRRAGSGMSGGAGRGARRPRRAVLQSGESTPPTSSGTPAGGIGQAPPVQRRSVRAMARGSSTWARAPSADGASSPRAEGDQQGASGPPLRQHQVTRAASSSARAGAAPPSARSALSPMPAQKSTAVRS